MKTQTKTGTYIITRAMNQNQLTGWLTDFLQNSSQLVSNYLSNWVTVLQLFTVLI